MDVMWACCARANVSRENILEVHVVVFVGFCLLAFELENFSFLVLRPYVLSRGMFLTRNISRFRNSSFSNFASLTLVSGLNVSQCWLDLDAKNWSLFEKRSEFSILAYVK